MTLLQGLRLMTSVAQPVFDKREETVSSHFLENTFCSIYVKLCMISLEHLRATLYSLTCF